MHQVGAGVLGPVFRGYDPEHDRAVAIKAFSLDLTPEQARDLAADLDRLPGLSLKHPSVVVPFAAGADGSTAYLVQEYFVAESADVALKQYGPAPVPDAMRLIGQLAGALDFAAAAGVHHGALHPRDILVAPHEVRLSGLGVLEALERVGFRAPARRPYAAPERAAGGPITTRADVFSLACVSFELLTGRKPSLSGESVTVETDSIQSADPTALAEAFSRALSVRPGDRYPSALSFAAGLKHALTGEPLLAGEAAERPRTRRAVRSASRKTPVPSESTPAAPPPPAPDAAHGGTGETAVDEAPGGELPLEPAAREPLPVVPPAGSTPLPAFLESYRPTAAEPLEPETPPVVPEPVQTDIEPLDHDRSDMPPAFVATDDLAGPDRKPERRATKPAEPVLAVVPELPPDVPGDARISDEFDRRLEHTMEIPVASRGEAEPAGEPVVRAAPEESSRGPSMFESEPPVSPAAPGARTSLVSLLGMLLVGILIGFFVGYLVAPKGAADTAGAGTRPAASTPAAAQPSQSPAPAATGPTTPAGTSAQSPVPAAAAPPQTAAPAPAPAAAPPAAVTPAPAKAPVKATQKPATPSRAKSQTTRTAAAAAGQASKPPAARAKAFEGSLVIASKPDGAMVQLDGRPIGTTPLTLQAVTAGAHAIRIELAGYQIWSSSVQVTAGKVNRVTASLDRRPGG